MHVLVILKPDCLLQGLTSHILGLLNASDLSVCHRESRYLTGQEVNELYRKHLTNETYDKLKAHMLGGLCELIIVEGEQCLSKLRHLKGRTGSGLGVRGQFAQDFIRNVIHTPDTPLQAQQELVLFYPQYRSCSRTPKRRMVFGLSGFSESGKSTAGLHLSNLGIKRLKIRSLLDEQWAVRWPTFQNVDSWVLHMLKQDPIALRFVLSDAIANALDMVDRGCSIESLGDPGTALHLREQFQTEFHLLWIDASHEVRVLRQLATGNHQNIELADMELRRRDYEKESLWSLGQVRGLAQEIISNEGTVEEYRANLTLVFERCYDLFE